VVYVQLQTLSKIRVVNVYDQIQVPIMKEIHNWDPERIIGLTRAAIRLGHHPHE
jgi:hypothetical protein